jgi:hypothetical protein
MDKTQRQKRKLVMKKVLTALFALASLAFLPTFASAAPCGAGSKGNCSWTCKGNVAQVTCSNPDGPDRCYVVDGSGSHTATCDGFKKYSSIGRMSMNDLVNYDSNRNRKMKAALIRTKFVINGIDKGIKKHKTNVRNLNVHIARLSVQLRRLVTARNKSILAIRKLSQKKHKYSKNLRGLRR